MVWTGRLGLRAWRDGERTVVRDQHVGPLRVLAALHPEGPGVSHQVLVHPPGGLVGGDELSLDLDLDRDAHVLVTTAGATRLYRSAGGVASQHVTARIGEAARLEWLPLETIVYPGAHSRARLRFELAAGARMIGFDVLALGLPASARPFVSGEHRQHLEVAGTWLERARIEAADRRLLDSPLGWDGHEVLATAWAAAGSAFDAAERTRLADAGREVVGRSSLAARAGLTSPAPSLLVVRALADRVEPAFEMLQRLWTAWRPLALGLTACPPRVWRT